MYVSIYDINFVFSNANVISNILSHKEVINGDFYHKNGDVTIYKTIDNKRILVGTFQHFGDEYIYGAIKDLTGPKVVLTITSWGFAILMGLGFLWNYYNTNNVVNDLLLGIDNITDSAKEIKGKKLSKRIELESDNTSIKNLIDTLNLMLVRVEKSFIQIGEFTDNVSHELKTPITSIKSLIEVELSKERTVEEYQEDLVKILEEVNWLNEIIQKLLILTKNPENITKHFQPVDLKKIVNDLCDLVELLILEKGITFNYNLGQNEIKILGDPDLIRDIFINIISNSVKYNKVKGSIDISSFVVEDRVGIKITDTGIGIKKENLNKITDRFFREDKVRTTKKSGSGLGLSIVSHLIKIHNGTLEVESEEGVGTSVTVLFPSYKEI